MKYAKIDISASGDATIVAGVAGAKIRVINYLLATDTATKITFKSASTALTGPMSVEANTNLFNENTAHLPIGLFGVMETDVGEALVINSSVSAIVGGHLTYILVTV